MTRSPWRNAKAEKIAPLDLRRWICVDGFALPKNFQQDALRINEIAGDDALRSISAGWRHGLACPPTDQVSFE
jgi:hypothetical protein